MPLAPRAATVPISVVNESWKLTQADVAEALDLSRSAISEMEAGRRRVSGLELHRLAYLYGRDMSDFLRGDFEQQGAVAALFRRHPNVAFDACAMDSLRHCMALSREAANLERTLGRSPRSTKIPDYSEAPPGSRWAAVEEGSAAATAERRRLGMESGPLPDMAGMLESQGVRTALVRLPDNVSGVALMDQRSRFLVAANRSHSVTRRRFSFAHEYAHVVFDRRAEGTVSHRGARDELREVRANAFAAAFLMPGAAVRSFVADLSKGRPSRLQAVVYDGNDALPVTGRSNRNNQRLRLHDVVLLAHYFVVSCPAILYRLSSLRMISDKERSAMAAQHESGLSRNLLQLFGLASPHEARERDQFQARLVNLALEAYRRDAITRRKLKEIVGLTTADADQSDIPVPILELMEAP